MQRFSSTNRMIVLWAMRTAIAVAALIAFSSSGWALSGTYTIGATGNYTTVEAAISALNSGGAQGPVTFLIQSGTYSPTSGYYQLGSVTGMSATNTVTFKPAVGATVLFSSSNTTYPTFWLIAASYYVFDGSNVAGGTSKNMTIRNTAGPAISIQNASQYNMFKYSTIIGASASYGTITMMYYYPNSYGTGPGNFNTFKGNTIGDINGTYRSYYSVQMYGYPSSGSIYLLNTVLDSNDIVNIGVPPTTGGSYFYMYGIYGQYCTNNRISNNTIRNTGSVSVSGVTYAYHYVYPLYFPQLGPYAYYNGNTADTISGNTITTMYGVASSSYAYWYLYPVYIYLYPSYYTSSYTSTLNFTGNTITNLVPSSEQCYYGNVYDYLYDYHYSNYGTSFFNVVGNKFVNIIGATPGAYVYEYTMMLYAYEYYGYGPCTYNVTNNFMTERGSTNIYNYGAYQYIYSYYESANLIFNFDNNTLFTSGTSGSYSSYLEYCYLYQYYATAGQSITYNHRNNIVASTIPSTVSQLGYFYSYTTGTGTQTLTSNNNLYRTAGGYFYNSTSSLSAWQAASGRDANSIQAATAIPFVNSTTGDLHINAGCTPPFVGEGRAIPIPGLTTDVDGETRYSFAPDIGADEGAFNGGGITVVSPNGGEQVTVNAPAVVTFTTTRPLNVSVQISTDGGATWINNGSVNPTNTGVNNFTINTPNTTSNTALVRVMTNANPYNSICEGDTSNAVFQLVRPVVRVLSPNGGEVLYGGDVLNCAGIPSVGIKWSSQFVPVGMYVHLDYSVDNGATWVNVGQNIPSPNLVTNCYNWTVPNVIGGTTNALVRVRLGAPDLPMIAGTINDVSDNKFTLLQTPKVTVVAPNGPTDQMFVNEPYNIKWASINTNEVKIEYSTDLGNTWKLITDHVPAYVGSYAWLVPNLTSSQLCSLLVRITNQERPQYWDISDQAACGVASMIQVYSPNGGETYELAQQVTAQWFYQNCTINQLDYSYDNGVTWIPIKTIDFSSLGMPAGVYTGTYSYTFTPPTIPTDKALIRVTNVDRPAIYDRSDNTFSILPGKSIVIQAPGAGTEVVRSTQTTIRWKATRISKVNIRYSLDGGSTWVTLATNVDAFQSGYLWTVPSTLTDRAKIRVEEVGGTVYAESDIFRIVASIASTDPTIRVTAPNGGETYQVGNPVNITWTSTGVQNVSLFYSMDAGATWKIITGGLLATTGSYGWSPVIPGTQYRIKADASQAVDASDGNFTVQASVNPKITVLYPNGGEVFTGDSSVTVRWTEKDIPANTPVNVEFSTDNSATWTAIGTVMSGTNSIAWVVPVLATESKVSFVRVVATGAADASDAAFTIRPKALQPIRVLTPNGGEKWNDQGVSYDITWSAPADVTNVRIEFSLDGGTSWSDIIAGTPSVPGNQKYSWKTPTLTTTSTSALVRITEIGGTRTDISDNTFTLTHRTSGVSDGAVTGTGGMKLLGNYPNPFADRTELRWVQPNAGSVSIRLFDQTGRAVIESNLGVRPAGENRFELLAGKIASGVYMYEVQAGTEIAHSTVMIVR